jgi:hypothetical protein
MKHIATPKELAQNDRSIERTPQRAAGSFRRLGARSGALCTIALFLNLGVAVVYAGQKPVKMTFSGTSETSATNLQQPDTSNDADHFAGNGTLGSFSLRNVRAIANTPSASPSCSGANKLFFAEPAGGGVFRFADGSLLYLHLTHGGDCIDLVANEAHCTLTFQITGGTGRFKEASGVLRMTETVVTVLIDDLKNPVFFAATGGFTGTISGVDERQDAGENQ